MLSSNDCLVSVIACVDTLAVITGQVSTSFNTALFYLLWYYIGVRCVETYSCK